MIELVDLRRWKKQKEIILELHRDWGINISSREWREQVKKWNKKWADGEVDYCVTHSNSNGYKATVDFNEAMIAVNDFRSRCSEMKKREVDILRGFELKNMYKLKIEEE